uniref:Uncharacterized protein n=1 Tax=blood disease bacterium R229 TaxID=741978 RepID=G2ZSD6_9RALS|nr:hypothetical protein BDB_170043 [blood disease bacterium R229]
MAGPFHPEAAGVNRLDARRDACTARTERAPGASPCHTRVWREVQVEAAALLKIRTIEEDKWDA